jgi:alpha-beta hydrolase superfamily lysophospholipase
MRPQAVLVLAHGLGEHGGAYGHVVDSLQARLDIDVMAMDFRGHGRSPGRRGVVRHYQELLDDLHAVVDWAHGVSPDLPLFVLGHSLGGQVVLRFALQAPAYVAGVVVSNPAIRVAMPVSRTKLRIGKILLAMAPWITLRADAPSAWMTRDPLMQKFYEADTLRHHRISAPLFFGMVETGESLLARAGEIALPIAMLIGGQDPVICSKANREFFDRLASDDKTFLLYPRMLHEPLNELGREQVMDDVIRWLAPRIGMDL